MFNKQHLVSIAVGAVTMAAIGSAAFSFAATNPTSTAPAHMPGVGGTVSAVSGNTVTLVGRDGKTYSVDVGSATITKDETVTVADIKVGDTIMAGGTVNGMSVTATNVHDGKMPMGGHGHKFGGHFPNWGKNPASATTSTTTQ